MAGSDDLRFVPKRPDEPGYKVRDFGGGYLGTGQPSGNARQRRVARRRRALLEHQCDRIGYDDTGHCRWCGKDGAPK